MFIERIRIANFKSLKDVEVRPEGLTALVGPNNAGKTNFVLALRFLSEVAHHGLEMAVARAGGIENIARRRARRSLGPITFEVQATLPRKSGEPETADVDSILSDLLTGGFSRATVNYSFSFTGSSGGNRGAFAVVGEELRATVPEAAEQPWAEAGDDRVYEVSRNAEGIIHIALPDPPSAATNRLRPWVGSFPALARRMGRESPRLGKQEILLHSNLNSDPFLYALSEALRGVTVCRFSAEGLRATGIPTPNPVLTDAGGNLPSMVDWLQRREKSRWAEVLNGMRDLVPGLERILVEPDASTGLSLAFLEKGFGRAWKAGEVSDGTIHALGMLVAAADPRVSAVVIDQPENSLHPWMIHEFGKRFRKLAKAKTIILTTQSPVVMDLLYPKEVWVVSRRKGVTSIRSLVGLDPSIERDWGDGVAKLSTFLGSGLVPRAVPGGSDR